MDSKTDADRGSRACDGSTVSLIDFQMTVANLSVAEHALREEPYERLPYLAGSLSMAAHQMEQLRQEVMGLRRVCEFAREACRENLVYAAVKNEQVLLEAFNKCDAVLNP